MSNQALRDKLFHALRGDALPGLKELDDLVLADIDKIMPIVLEHCAMEFHRGEIAERETWHASWPRLVQACKDVDVRQYLPAKSDVV